MLQRRLRKSSSSDNRRSNAIDGVMNAPKRSGMTRTEASKRFYGSDSFNSTTSRGVDDFRRKEGFHASNQLQSANRASMPGGLPGEKAKKEQPSILHMNLPGGSLEGANERKRSQSKFKKKKGGARKWALRMSAVTAAFLILVGGYLFFKAYFGANQVFQGGGKAAALSCGADVDPSELKEEGDGRINMLLVGLDNEASLTDTILVASIDPVSDTSTVLSIPRDLWVEGPTGSQSKVNAVHSYAKQAALLDNPDNEKAAQKEAVKSLESVVEKVLGVQIHYYATVDVTGFERAVKIMDGVDVNVPEELAVSENLWDDVRNESYYLDVPAGQQHLDPQRALWFVRSRHTSPRGDFDRTARQRLFLQALGSQALSAGTLTNPVRLSNLMDTFSDSVTTNLSIDDALCLSKVVQGETDDLGSIGLADPPDQVVTTGVVGSQSVVTPVVGAGDYSQVHEFIRSRLVDGYIVRENARVLVLNGTSQAGLASETADMLRSYGYIVTGAKDAPSSDYRANAVVDLKGDNPYTKHYLEQRFDTSTTGNLPEGVLLTEQREKTDFVIILGE